MEIEEIRAPDTRPAYEDSQNPYLATTADPGDAFTTPPPPGIRRRSRSVIHHLARAFPNESLEPLG